MVLRMSFVGAQQLLLGSRIAHSVIDAHLADFFPVLRHVDNEPVDDPAQPACLVIDSLDCGGHYLKIVIGFKSFVHLGLVPEFLEQGADDAEETGDLGQDTVSGTLSQSNGE